MSTVIMTDSASDFTQEELAEMNVRSVPLSVVFSDGTYRDGIDMTHDEFFEKLIESPEVPTTSQTTPGMYQEVFDEVLAAGDDIVVVTLSSGLSGCYQSACMAKEMYTPEQQEHIFIVDSKNATIGEQILVLAALKMREDNMPAAQIAAELEKLVPRVKLIAMLDTLEFLKKGGRIPAGVAFVGTLLSVKPVITVTDGLVEVIGKARGSKNANNMLTEFTMKEGGIDFSLPYKAAYSGLSDKLLQKYLKDSSHLYEDETSVVPISSIGSVIGTHVGPGAIAVAFFAKEA